MPSSSAANPVAEDRDVTDGDDNDDDKDEELAPKECAQNADDAYDQTNTPNSVAPIRLDVGDDAAILDLDCSQGTRKQQQQKQGTTIRKSRKDHHHHQPPAGLSSGIDEGNKILYLTTY